MVQPSLSHCRFKNVTGFEQQDSSNLTLTGARSLGDTVPKTASAVMVLVAESHIDPSVEVKETQKQKTRNDRPVGGKRKTQHIYSTASAEWLINSEPPAASCPA